jgi:hypothetical protein
LFFFVFFFVLEVLELLDPSVLARIECPANVNDSLAIRNMPYLVLQVKNLGSFFTFEIELLDGEKKIRRFRCSNFQLDTKLKDDICVMPLVLSSEVRLFVVSWFKLLIVEKIGLEHCAVGFAPVASKSLWYSVGGILWDCNSREYTNSSGLSLRNARVRRKPAR